MIAARGLRGLAALTVAAVGLGLAPASKAAGAVPDYAMQIGGPGHAETYPSGLETAPDGTVVVADTGNDRVRKYTGDGTLIWSVGTTGSGPSQFRNPRDIGIDASGTIYVADNTNRRVAVLGPNGSWIGAYAGNVAGFGAPIGITVTGNRIYLPDAPNNKLVILDLAGNPVQVVADPGGACAFNRPRDVDVDAAGNLYVANYISRNVLKLNPAGACITQWGAEENGPGAMRNPYGVRVAPDPVLGQELVYVADAGNAVLTAFTTDGAHVGTAGGPGVNSQPGTFEELRRVAVATDGSGDIWGADLWGSRVERFARTATGWEFADSIADAPAPLENDAAFNEARGVAFDAHGGIVVADTVNQRWVKADADGNIVGACGRRGHANGEFNWLRGVAIDPGIPTQVWVADTKQSRLQVMDLDTCQPVGHKRIGSKGSGPDDFHWPHSITIRPGDRIAWVSDTNNDRIKAIDVTSGVTLANFGTHGAGTGQFHQPRGVAVSPVDGHVFVADRSNHRIVELSDTAGTGISVVRTITGGFADPEGVAVDASGRIYVADSGNSRVVLLDRDGSPLGELSAPGGFDRPENVAVAPDGQVYVSDTYNDRVLVFGEATDPGDPGGGGESGYLGDIVEAGKADIYPVDVENTASRYYILDTGGYRVMAADRASGAILHTVGGQGSGPGQFGAARDIAVAPNGDIYVADTPNNRVQRFTADLDYIGQWGTRGTGNGQFTLDYGVAIGPGKGAGGAAATVVYTTDAARVQKFTLDGTHLATFGDGTLNQPRGLAVHPVTHDLYVLSARDNEVVVYDEDGIERFRFGSPGTGPGQFKRDMRGIDITAGGEVYIVDEGNSRVQVFDSAGGHLRTFGEPGHGDGQFDEARGITVTADGKVAVADLFDFAIEEFTTAGAFVRQLFGNPPPPTGVNSPRGIDFDSQGNLFTVDWWNQRIIRTTPTGASTTFGYRGGPTEVGSINYAWDVAIQPGTDRIFVANRENHEVEVFDNVGNYVTRWAKRGSEPGDLLFPQSLAFAPNGDLIVSDTDNSRLSRYSIDAAGNGTFIGSYGSYGTEADGPGRLNTATGLDIAPDGTIWVADTRNNSIQKRTPDGVWTRYRHPVDSPAVAFRIPWGVTVAADGTVWVTDTGNNRLVQMTADAELISVLTPTGDAALNGPFEVIFGANGRMYISDTWNSRVAEWGTVTTPTTTTSTTSTSTTTTSTTPTTTSTTSTSTTSTSAPSSTTTTTQGPGLGGAGVRSGYWMLGSDGAVYHFGDAAALGTGAGRVTGTAGDIEPTPSGNGYWIVDANGSVLAFGDAAIHPSRRAAQLSAGERVTSLSATPTGKGYWLFTTRGRVLPHGDAAFFGDMSATVLNGPVLDSVPTTTGRGYYMVASDGGLFAFGDAVFRGSMGATPLNAPVQSLVPDPDGAGYWLVASDGGVFAFEAPFRGSMGSVSLNKPITGMVAFGNGYLMVATDGGVFNFSTKPFHGSLGHNPPQHPITAIAALD